MNPTKDQLDRGPATMPGEERRRSQRVIIRVPVTLEMVVHGEVLKISAHTVAVNIHGAMVLCSRMIDAGITLEVVNDRSRERTTSRITRQPRESAEGYLVPIEFTAATPGFWQISFPPENWKPSEG